MQFDATTLPSRTIPYQVKLVEIQKFRPKQLSLLSKAIFLESMEPAIKAMQDVCNIDVNLMTPGDFYFLLAWQRFNCLSRGVSATWNCQGTLFRRAETNEIYTVDRINRMTESWIAAEGLPEQAQLENPDKVQLNASICNAYNVKALEFADFTTIFLPDVELDKRLDYPRVRHMVEYDKLVNDPTYGKIVGAARWVAEGSTLEQKIEVLFDQPDMDLFETAAAANATIVHGISRTVEKKCDTCGTTHSFATSVEPASFFI
jgi:hypothetical protein